MTWARIVVLSLVVAIAAIIAAWMFTPTSYLPFFDIGRVFNRNLTPRSHIPSFDVGQINEKLVGQTAANILLKEFMETDWLKAVEAVLDLLIFIGPTGTGKTFLAKLISEMFQRTPNEPVLHTFRMSNFRTEEALENFFAFEYSPLYQRCGVMFCVVLFDDFQQLPKDLAPDFFKQLLNYKNNNMKNFKVNTILHIMTFEITSLVNSDAKVFAEDHDNFLLTTLLSPHIGQVNRQSSVLVEFRKYTANALSKHYSIPVEASSNSRIKLHVIPFELLSRKEMKQLFKFVLIKARLRLQMVRFAQTGKWQEIEFDESIGEGAISQIASASKDIEQATLSKSGQYLKDAIEKLAEEDLTDNDYCSILSARSLNHWESAVYDFVRNIKSDSDCLKISLLDGELKWSVCSWFENYF